MSQITIPARDIRAGDTLNLGGRPVTVGASYKAYREDLWRIGLVTDPNPLDPGQSLLVVADAMFTVERPDPDEALIEVMAKAAFAHYYPGQLSTPVQARGFRDEMRAVLAAAREAGAL